MNIKTLSWLEIDTKIFKENLKVMASVLSFKTRFMLMVKGNAYGHGLIEMSEVAVKAGTSFLGVSSLQEAISLRANGIKIPILLLTQVESSLISDLVEYKITPTVYDLSYVKQLSDLAIKKKKLISIHLKIDTGLNRFGFKVDESLQQVIEIANLKNIKIEGVFTHFADAIDDLLSAKKQLALFNKLCEDMKASGVEPEFKHTSNSPALVWLKDSHFNLVRFGLAAYGLQPSSTRKYPLPIHPVLTWKTKILQIKRVQKGEYVGYGKSFRAAKDMTIAVIGVGYADGFRRLPFNYGEVLVKGKKLRVVGNVTMNFTMVDVTELEGLRIYEEVVLIGKQRRSCITLEEIARVSRTINEEIVTSISALVPRIYTE